MIYKFNDTTPQGGALEQYRDPEHIPSENAIRQEIESGYVSPNATQLAKWLREKQYGVDVREAIALLVEDTSVLLNRRTQQNNIIINPNFGGGDVSLVGHNAGTTVSPAYLDETSWAQVNGDPNKGNTDVYFSPSLADASTANWKYTKWNFSFEVVTLTAIRLGVSLDIFLNGQITRLPLCDYLVPTYGVRQRVSAVIPTIYDLAVLTEGTTPDAVNFVITCDRAPDDNTGDMTFEYKITNVCLRREFDGVAGLGDQKFIREVKQVDNIFPDSEFISGNPNVMRNNQNIKFGIFRDRAKNWLTVERNDLIAPKGNDDVYFPATEDRIARPMNSLRYAAWDFSFDVVADKPCTVFADFDYWIAGDSLAKRIQLASQVTAFYVPTHIEAHLPAINNGYLTSDQTLVAANFVIHTDQADPDYRITNVVIKPSYRGV